MKTIFKYRIPVNQGPFIIPIPENFQVLSVGIQNDVPYLWAEVDTTNTLLDAKFELVWTGRQLPVTKSPLTFIDTVRATDVLHIYQHDVSIPDCYGCLKDTGNFRQEIKTIKGVDTCN